MKQIIISCRMIEQELTRILKEEKIDIPVLFVPAGLHLEPDKLKGYLQNLIDSIDNVDRILLTLSDCGHATTGLTATTAELVLPNCSDCIDLLLTKDRFADRKRSHDSMFMTESWLEKSEAFPGSYLEAEERYGTEAADEMLKMLYENYHYYELIDTGTYDLDLVREYLEPRAEVTGMKFKITEGPCTPLRKLVTGQIDEDFLVIPKGQSVIGGMFRIMY